MFFNKTFVNYSTSFLGQQSRTKKCHTTENIHRIWETVKNLKLLNDGLSKR